MKIRCKFFDNDGRPLDDNPCPKGNACSYVHPNQKELWNSLPAYRSYYRGDDRDNRRGYNASERSRQRSPPPPRSGMASSSAAHSVRSSTWDNTMDPPPTSSRDKDNHTWGKLDDSTRGKSDGSGWGKSDGSGWGKSDGSGWGKSDSGWGKSDSGWGTNSKGQGGWDTTGNTGWPTTTGSFGNASSTTSKFDAAEDYGHRTQKAADPGSIAGPSGWRTSGTFSSAADPDAMQIDDVPPTHSWGRRALGSDAASRPAERAQSPPQSAAKKQPLPKLPPIRTSVTPGPMQSPTPSALTPKHRKSLSGLQLEATARSVLAEGSSGLRVSENGSSRPTTTSSRDPNAVPSYDGPGGASRLYVDTIKAIRNCAIAEVILQRARKHNEQQEAMIKSSHRDATTGSKIIMEDIQKASSNKMRKLMTRRKEKLKILLSLPDLSEKLAMDISGPLQVTAAIRGYSEELQSWFDEVELHKRLLQEELEPRHKAPQHSAPPPPVQTIQSSEPTELDVSKLPELLEKDQWSWQDLKNAATMLGSVIDATREAVYDRLYVKEDEQHISDMVNARMPQEIVPQNKLLETYDAEISQASSTINIMGEVVQEQSEEIANLLNKIANMEQNLEALKKENEDIDTLVAQANAQFAQFDLIAEQDAKDLEELTAKLQSLHYTKHNTAKGPPPPLPVDLSEISGLLKPGVTSIVTNQLEPALNMLLQQCKDNQENFLKELDTLIAPLNSDTDKLLNYQP